MEVPMKEFIFEEAAAYLGVSTEIFSRLVGNNEISGQLCFAGVPHLFSQKHLDRIRERFMITDDGYLLEKGSAFSGVMSEACQVSIENFFSEYEKDPWFNPPAHIVGFTYVGGKPIPKVLGFCVYDGEADRQDLFSEYNALYSESHILAFVCPWCGKVHFHYAHIEDQFVYSPCSCHKVDGYIVCGTDNPELAGFIR